MRSSAILTRAIFPLLFGCMALGCGESSEVPSEVGEAPGPLVLTNTSSLLEVEAPAGQFNIFGIWASYNTDSCGLTEHVYGVLGPSGIRIEDCPECLLPGTVHIGEAIPGFDLFACLPGSQACEITEDVTGLTFDDLNYETYLCGEIVMPDSFTVEYQHLDTTEPEAPRTWVTVTGMFRLDESGAPEVISEWERCVLNESGEICDGPSGSETW
jgi:hypothetical protein